MSIVGDQSIMVKVSVIIPVYNVEPYLKQCMDSVVGQTLKDIEIICVDDGSTDGSLDILREYEAEDNRIQIIEQKNAGAGAARNNGMRHATGKYLSFLDSDDFFEPRMLEKAYDLAEKDQADFVAYKSDQYHTEKKQFVSADWVIHENEIPPYHPFNHRQMTGNVFKVFVGWAWDKLFLKEFVDKHHLTFQEQRTSNDLLFVFSAVVLAKKISVVPMVLAHQRRDAKDSLSKTREYSWDCFYHALMALRDKLREENLYKELEKDYINYALHFSLWNYNTLSEPTKTKLKDKLKTEWFREFGVEGKSKDYFYNKQEFEQCQKIMGNMKKENKTMGFKQKLKGFLRKIVPAGRTYIDKKFKDQEKYIKKQLKEQEKLIKLQQKNMQEMQKNLKEYIEQEFVRRENWAKMPAEIKRVADGRKVWVIKCPATEGEAKFFWGDYYYAVALQKYLERQNIYAIIDNRQDWGCDEEADVVLVLRGKYFYHPDRRNEKCLYIMWNISHPDMISKAEYELYDVVCAASRHMAEELKDKISVPVVPLLQCTDTEIFCPEGETKKQYNGQYIFIGSTRGVMRDCVYWAAEAGVPLHVWGSGWYEMMPEHKDVVDGTFMPNDKLPALYRSAKVTLNDHWKDMLDNQIINNRIFDALACGLPVISDGCEEMKEIFPDAVLYYDTKKEFDACIKKVETDYETVKAKALEQYDMIKKEYSFERRVEELLEIAEKYKK